MTLRLITPAISQAISLADAKAHLRVTANSEDAYINLLIEAACSHAEHELGRALLEQTWEKTFDVFPSSIRLDYPPLIDVTHIKYFDAAGVEQTLAPSEYFVDSKSEPGWILPGYGKEWPTTYGRANDVTVRFRAGYASAAAVPSPVKSWVLLLIGSMYENRESEITGTIVARLGFADRLLDRYRIVRL